MAGAGYRNFTPNEVLTADQVQNFLMDQSVMVFDDASERDNALTGVASEGMLAYLRFENKVYSYNGFGAWEEVGKQPGPAEPLSRGTVFGNTDELNPDLTFIGFNAGTKLITEGSSDSNNQSVFLGYNTGFDATGARNTIVGSNSGTDVATDNNILLGHGIISRLSGDRNIVIGGGGNAYKNNVIIGGSGAGNSPDPSVLENCLILGYLASPSSDTAVDEITLGNTAINTLRCATGSITTFSDRRDKKNIEDLNVGLNLINELKPVKFDWDMREGGKVDKPDSGFIAQDIIEAEDKLGVHDYLKLSMRNNEDRYEVSASRLIPVLVNAVKELSAEVEALKAQVAEK